MKTTKELQQLARRAIEIHLGDVVSEDAIYEELYDNAFVLAHDALIDVGVAAHVASWVAGEEASKVVNEAF